VGCVHMVEIVIWLVLANIAATLGMIAYLRKEKMDLEEIHDRFDELSNSLNVVAAVLQNLDQLMPSFHLPQQHPIQALLEFLKGMRGDEPSNPDTLLRDDVGQFTDGQEAEAEITS